MTLPRRTLLACSAASFAAAAHRSARAEDGTHPPTAREAPVTDDVFGTKVTDPYRWMEQPGSREFTDYLHAEDAYAREMLARIPGRPALAAAIARYTGGIAATRNPQVVGQLLFLEMRPPGTETYKLTVRTLPGGAPRTLIDPDLPRDGKKRALNWWQPSQDGRLVAYGISEAGSEDAILRIMETETGRVLPDTIDRVPYASPSWLPDGKSFAYNRLATGEKTSIDRYKHSICWLHHVGTPSEQDTKLLAQGEYRNVAILDTEFPGVVVTPGSATALGLLVNGVQNELTLYAAPLASLGQPATPWAPVCTPADKITGFTARADELYLLTYANAPKYRLLRTSAAHPDVKSAHEVVPASDILLDNAYAARDGIYLAGRNARGLGDLRRLGNDGRITPLALPFEGSISNVFADPREDGLWFQLASWTTPPRLCHATADGHVTATDYAPPAPYDTSAYTSRTVLATARDGARVPLSIIEKKGRAPGPAPTILTAYGSYGISIDPEFSPRYLAWLDLGGIYAVAHVRGGGELGHAWYEAGKKQTKPNTWRDLISCAQYLISDGITSPAKLAIEGTSAGGITVGRALTERPDLFAVVLSRVGVSNAARSEFSPNGPPNIPEFGSVTDRATAHALLEMDALYHVKDGTKYPSIVFTTGLQDPRVSPWEPGKMAARVQKATASDNPVILRVEGQGGHGVGSTRSQFDEEYADLFAFALWRMGDKRYQPKG